MSFTLLLPPDTTADMTFSTFLEHYRDKLRQVFHERARTDTLALQRGIPPFVLREIRSCDPLSVYIPKEYGGRGGHIHEGLAVLAASSYESLALSLTFGINWALFLQPVAKYSLEEVRAPIFDRFLIQKNMGGLMITEPDYGSDALNMQTAYTTTEDHYHIQGLKHWGGLTGWADFWLITARERGHDGNLKRDIDFFICDVTQPDQGIVVEEVFHNLGLYMIPYGRNRIDIRVPLSQKLQPHSTGVLMMLDLLHRSRMQFPGMGMGFLQRILDEAIAHCNTRLVGGMHLTQYDQVQHRLAAMQAYFTVCSAMCAYSSDHAHLAHDLSRHGLIANATKAVITDYMQEASQSLLQLVGAKGYRLDHLAGRSVVDSRPFQIFEGSNDILYHQIAEAALKEMRRMKSTSFHDYLTAQPLTARAADRLKTLTSFALDDKISQRKLYDLGRVLGRIVCMNLVILLGEKGFKPSLIENALAMLTQEVAALLASYHQATTAQVVDDYQDGGDWLQCLHPA